MLRITHESRPDWFRKAETIEEARAIIRTQCGGYMDDAPHFNESDAVELWNESAAEGCGIYAIEEVA
jgi:hypothetical protein